MRKTQETGNEQMSFGKEFTRLRRLKGVTQKDIAIKLGCDTGYLSRVANDLTGYPPTDERVDEIAAILGLSEGERDALFLASNRIPPEITKEIQRNAPLWARIRKGIPYK